jgi:hypothetical protein
MAQHEICAAFQAPVEIINRDLEVTVKRNGKVFGTLTLSKGTIDWRPMKKRIGGRNEVRMKWTQFDKKMRG